MSTSSSLYHRHLFPSEIISHCVWLYFRFSLSFRDVEELMSSRGVSLSYEKVMRGFKSAGHAQRFLSAFGIITSHFRVGRHLYRASAYRAVMKSRFAMWKEAIRVEAIVN